MTTFDFIKRSLQEKKDIKELKREAKAKAKKRLLQNDSDYKKRLEEKYYNQELKKLEKEYDKPEFGERVSNGFVKLGDKLGDVGKTMIKNSKKNLSGNSTHTSRYSVNKKQNTSYLNKYK